MDKTDKTNLLYGESQIAIKLDEINSIIHAIKSGTGNKEVVELESKFKDYNNFLDCVYSFKDLKELLKELPPIEGENPKLRRERIIKRLDNILYQLRSVYDNFVNDITKDKADLNYKLKLSDINLKTSSDIDFEQAKMLFKESINSVNILQKQFYNIKSLNGSVNNLKERISEIKEVTKELDKITKEAKIKLPNTEQHSLKINDINFNGDFYFTSCKSQQQINLTNINSEFHKEYEQLIQEQENLEKTKTELFTELKKILPGIEINEDSLRQKLNEFNQEEENLIKFENLKELLEKKQSVLNNIQLSDKDVEFIENDKEKEILIKVLKRLENIIALKKPFLDEINERIRYCHNEECEKNKCKKFIFTENILKEQNIKITFEIKFFGQLPKQHYIDFLIKKKLDNKIINQYIRNLLRNFYNGIANYGLATPTKGDKYIDIFCKSERKRPEIQKILARYISYILTNLNRLLEGKESSASKKIKEVSRELKPNLSDESIKSLTITNLHEYFKDFSNKSKSKELIERYFNLMGKLTNFRNIKFKKLKIKKLNEIALIKFIKETKKN